MPTYDFKCKKCGKIFEKYQSIIYPSPRCIYCRGTTIRMIGAGSALIFRGEGFYINDSKKRERKNK